MTIEIINNERKKKSECMRGHVPAVSKQGHRTRPITYSHLNEHGDQSNHRYPFRFLFVGEKDAAIFMFNTTVVLHEFSCQYFIFSREKSPRVRHSRHQ